MNESMIAKVPSPAVDKVHAEIMHWGAAISVPAVAAIFDIESRIAHAKANHAFAVARGLAIAAGAYVDTPTQPGQERA